MMSTWKIEFNGKTPKLNKPVLIEGLPGIGNVGKVAADFMLDALKAKKLAEFQSYHYPHSVFINEENLVELPVIEIYYKKFKNKKNDLLFLVGDVQPVDEVSCYEFSHKLLDVAQDFNCKELVTLGGIAMKTLPKKPTVFCTGNCKSLIKSYKKSAKNINDSLYGVVGPIIGVSGVLLGLAAKRDINAVSLLAETYGHPMYVGVKGAKEILHILNKKLQLKLNLNLLDKEIDKLEQEISKHQNVMDIQIKRAITGMKGKGGKEINYIG